MLQRDGFAELVRRKWHDVLRVMVVPVDRPELVKAQYGAFHKQIPLLYSILLANSWILAFSFMNVAPVWLSLVCPLVLTAVCGVRMWLWWSAKSSTASAKQAGDALKRTVRLSAGLSIGFSAWSFSLFPYGSEVMQGHIAFYLAITGIGVIFCLTHLRSAAFMVAVVLNAGFVTFFFSTAHPTFMALAINVLLVIAAMLAIVMVNYRDFSDLVESRRVLQEAQEKTLALSNENFRLASLDSLTDLPNRRSFFSSLEKTVQEAAQARSQVIVGLLDLDGFKPVNDTYGHPVGDMLLVRIADRLAQRGDRAISVYRLGGDEFAVIFATADVEDAMQQARALCAALKEPFRLTACTARISGTMGLSVYPQMAADAHELFERADYALYRAKRSGGRGEPRLFSAADEAEIRRGSSIEQALRVANLEQELSLVYQPIIDVGSGGPIGFEALARWHSPSLGWVSPGEFIPTAERSSYISELTSVLLAKALREAERWPKTMRLSFNLSVHDISSPEHLLRITSIIGNSAIRPQRIDLEITESAMVNDVAVILQAVQALKAIGVGISIDDFGTGYSSLRQVHQLPLDRLKIDRSFVAGIDGNLASQQIVKSLIALCKDRGLACVVEGVETAEELAVVRGLGCQLVQGYYFSRPLAPDAVLDYLGGPRDAGREARSAAG